MLAASAACTTPNVTLLRSEREDVTRTSVHRADGQVIVVQSIWGQYEQSVFEHTDANTGEITIIEAYPFYEEVRAGAEGGLTLEDRAVVEDAIKAHCRTGQLGSPPDFDPDGAFWTSAACVQDS